MACSITATIFVKGSEEQYPVVVLKHHTVSDVLLRLSAKLNKPKVVGDILCGDSVLEDNANVFELVKEGKELFFSSKEEEQKEAKVS